MEEVDWAHAVVGKTVQNIIEDNLWDNESRLRVFFTDGTEAAWGVQSWDGYNEVFREVL